MAESLLLASMTVGGGFADTVVAMTSSHFASSERQYRFPLGYGGQRTPTSQWTVTGSGAALVRSQGKGPKITACTIGTVTDLGIKDANNMGAAMAPAALATVKAHFTDLHTGPEDFDRIVTGDLGQLGMEMLLELARLEGLKLGGKLMDCGIISNAEIDTWENEPDIDRELLRRAYIATPHIAGYSADGKTNADNMVIDSLCRFFNVPNPGLVSPPHLPASFSFNTPLDLYDPLFDTVLLKSHPEGFEEQRGNYRLRREKYEV